ncbi:MAG: hypothetical protein ABIR76_04840 [Polaromonas sp.]
MSAHEASTRNVLETSALNSIYPIPALARQLERDWAPELATYFKQDVDEVLASIRPWFDFPGGSLRIELMDGSILQFKHAIFIVSESKKTVAVFTEHCGNHIYPHHEAKIYRDGTLVYEQLS